MARIKALQAALTRPKPDDEDESEEAEMARQFAEQEAGWSEWNDNTGNNDDTTDNNQNNENINTTNNSKADASSKRNSTTVNDTTTTTANNVISINTPPITDTNTYDNTTVHTDNTKNHTSTVSDSAASLIPTLKPSGYSTLQPISDWSTASCIEWLHTIKLKLLSYQYIFDSKGWSDYDIQQWNAAVTTKFDIYTQYWATNHINGTILNTVNDNILHTKWNINEQYHRALMLSNLRQYRRKTLIKQ